MFRLDNIASAGKDRKRRGRGGSRGGTSGRGHKGQSSRSGGTSSIRTLFEGGQMSLARRLPRRGFTNSFRLPRMIVSLEQLETFFNAGDVVSLESLRAVGLVRTKTAVAVKILANGEITKALTISDAACTATARAAIEKCGGKVLVTGE